VQSSWRVWHESAVARHTWTAVALCLREVADHSHVSTGSLTVRIYKVPFRVEVVDTASGGSASALSS
jgi:hypothetical protein